MLQVIQLVEQLKFSSKWMVLLTQEETLVLIMNYIILIKSINGLMGLKLLNSCNLDQILALIKKHFNNYFLILVKLIYLVQMEVGLCIISEIFLDCLKPELWLNKMVWFKLINTHGHLVLLWLLICKLDMKNKSLVKLEIFIMLRHSILFSQWPCWKNLLQFFFVPMFFIIYWTQKLKTLILNCFKENLSKIFVWMILRNILFLELILLVLMLMSVCLWCNIVSGEYGELLINVDVNLMMILIIGYQFCLKMFLIVLVIVLLNLVIWNGNISMDSSVVLNWQLFLAV